MGKVILKFKASGPFFFLFSFPLFFNSCVLNKLVRSRILMMIYAMYELPWGVERKKSTRNKTLRAPLSCT